ncbi:unnamed protein product, partial [Rotaria sp. Silwood1]
GKVLISSGLCAQVPLEPPVFADTELYDPVTYMWTTTANMNSPRSYHTAIPLKDGKVLVFGGYYSNNLLSSAELYDPLKELWIKTGSMNTARSSHAFTI